MRNKSETVQVVLGTGLHQKLVLTPMKWKPEKRWALQVSGCYTRLYQTCTLTFHYGIVCLLLQLVKCCGHLVASNFKSFFHPEKLNI